MATAKKASKKTAVKKTASKAAAKKTAAKKSAPKQDVVKTTTDQATPAIISKQEARAAKAAAIVDAPEVKKTPNPEGSWPFPTGERP